MYTYCTIQWVDDGTVWENVVIKSDEEVINEIDDEIFFYGISPERLKQFCKDGTVVEDEWVVLSVDGTYDVLL